MRNIAVIIPISLSDTVNNFINEPDFSDFTPVFVGADFSFDGAVTIDCNSDDISEELKAGICYAEQNDFDFSVLICDNSIGIRDVRAMISLFEYDGNTLNCYKRNENRDVGFVMHTLKKLTDFMFRFITDRKMPELLPYIITVPEKYYKSVRSSHGHGREFFINMLTFSALSGAHVHSPVLDEQIDNREKIGYFKTMCLLFPYMFISKFVRFSLSSLFAFFIDWSIFEIIHIQLTKTSILDTFVTLLAQIGARVISSTVNFFVNYKLVFRSREKLPKAAAKYYSTVGIMLVMQAAIMFVLDTLLDISVAITPVIVQSITFVINYTLQKRLVYKRNKNKKISDS